MSVISNIMGFFGYVKRELLQSQISQNASLGEKLENLTAHNSYLANQNEHLKKDIQSEVEKTQHLTKQNAELESSTKNLQTQNDDLSKQNADFSFKNRLVAELLSDDSEKNEHLARFHKLLFEDFFDFANKEDSLANEAEAFCILQEIEKELEVITIYPEIYKKAIVGVGGAFSAGKSSFINSFINNDSVNLPISIEPTTAIPTYVVSQKQSTELNAFSSNGVMVNLSKLDSEIHSKIAHDFIKSFGFRLKKIMPFMVLKTPLYKEYEHLCFIDTPGFDAANDGFSNDDRQSAKEFLTNVNVMLWLINIEKGTISSEELGFLSDIDLSTKKLYIVLTMADKKPENERDEVFNEIRDNLESAGITVEGISMYSTKEYAKIDKTPLYKFLQSIKPDIKLHSNLVNRLISVYKMYAEAMLKKRANKKAIFDALHSLGLDLAERNINSDDKSRQRIKKIQEIFRTDSYDEMLQNLQNIIQEMKKVIDEIFGKPSRELPSIDSMDIKADFDLAIKQIIDKHSNELKQKQARANKVNSAQGIRNANEGVGFFGWRKLFGL